MPSDVEFLSKWKPNHKRGLLSYTLRYALPAIIPCILYILYLFISRPLSAENMSVIIWGSFFTLSILVISLITRWYSGEKKYKEIIDIRGDTMEGNLR